MKPQLCGSPRGPRHSPPAFAQGSLNHLFLLGSKLLRQFQLAFRIVCKRLPRHPTLIPVEIFGFEHNHGPLDDVLQLADITGPVIQYKKITMLLVSAAVAVSCFSSDTLDE